ncbi:hypothetical protein IC582_009158 [Cucumis melo]|uniref:Uncharacterized protein LOC103486742 isoform X2 n=1 Tax=Cucumis melo TaxID=3656 RepID=A0A1S3B6K8_CUCME|nr:uncharacterized protein LOC103486742 isoform X2 [Cucumis melo]
MGTREVYEQRLRSGNLYHEPTMNPGLGSPRCPRCFSLLKPDPDKSEWAVNPVLHDVTAVAGSGLGGLLSAVHAYNTGIPHLQSYVKGPKWLPFVIGVPALLLCSSAGATFGGFVLPRFTQLTVTSYYATSSASHYGVSLLTRRIEDNHTSQTQQASTQ